MESLWRKQTNLSDTELKDMQDQSPASYHRDIIVVGAGMAGLLIAYYLKEHGKNVLVLEADVIASGQTERTTAKITSQHALKYSKLIRQLGTEKARMYAQANEGAIREYERLIQSKGIECQFERRNAYLYTLQDDKQIEEEAKAALSLGIDASVTTETELPFSVEAAVCFQNQAQFQPLEFIRHIASELEIAEHTQVTAVKGNQVLTNRGAFSADRIVVATHYPLRNVPGFYFLRQHQERSYVLALSGCKKLEGMYYGIDQGGLSLRQAGDVLLLGGSAHRTGQNESGGACNALVAAAKQYFPEGKEVTRWSAQDCMPHDGIPFIGKYSIFTPNLYVATGFQKWGMTTSMVAAMILRDELCGIENPYRELFSPQRMNVRAGIGNLFLDIGMSVNGLVKGLFRRLQKKPYCAHMGCALTWNSDEQSWDCPCHGSRFEADGTLLDNPAKKCAQIGKLH